MGVLKVLGLLLLAAIGVWKFFSGRASRQRDRATAAQALFDEGMAAHDASKIVAAFNRVNRP